MSNQRSPVAMLLAAGMIGLGLWLTVDTLAKTDSGARPSRSTRGSPRTSPEVALGPLETKLAQIRANQQAILERLDDVMQELQIAKTRATLR